MELILQNAFAGFIGGVTAAAFIGLGKYVYEILKKRQDIKSIRKLLIDGRFRIMEADKMYAQTREHNEKIGLQSSAGKLRTMQYNNTMKELDVNLKSYVNLSPTQKKDIFDALDWYHTKNIFVNAKGNMPRISDGIWPYVEMTEDQAKEKFQKLEDIKWLKLGKLEN